MTCFHVVVIRIPKLKKLEGSSEAFQKILKVVERAAFKGNRFD